MASEANWVSHPGAYIKDEMDERSWSQRDLAFILGCSEQAINPILNGKRSVSPDMAKALGLAFDVPAEFFANLQQMYDLAHARNPDGSVEVRRKMQTAYPVREMIRRGWIELTDATMLEVQLGKFFEDQDIPYMAHAAKKTSYEERKILHPAQLAWLFRVRQIAKSISVPKYTEKALRSALPELEQLMYSPEEARRVPRLLMEAGVKFIIVEKLPNAGIDGVCLWLDNQPVIGMSLQHDRIDNFWFVLRHEIEHVLNGHGKREEMIDADLDGASNSVSEEERIANEAASDFCAPREKLESFMARKHPFYYEKDVIAFARIVQRHPGVVVGQIRKKLNRWDYLTRYLVKIRQHVLPGAIVDGWGQVVPVSL